MDSTNFLFDIVKLVKEFYETPVVFFTMKHYSDNVFNTLCSIRSENEETMEGRQNILVDRIVDYHLQWLHAVNEIESFRNKIEANEIPREAIYGAVNYTIDALNSRLKFFKRYVEKYKKGLSNKYQFDLVADIEIIEEMHNEVVDVLSHKTACYKNCDDDEAFKIKILAGIDELLHWLDKIYDDLSITLSNHLQLTIPHMSDDMTKTLQQIVDELRHSASDSAHKLLAELKEKGKEISTMIRKTGTRKLEISKITNKISVLEGRIARLEHEGASAAILALKNKKQFLEKRLADLESLKTTITKLNEEAGVNYDEDHERQLCECEDFFTLRIFNHDLPIDGRERLVTELCFLWDLAVYGEKPRDSIISILSATEAKEEFSDELGTFFVDENSRKIYKIPGDKTLYQANEANKLVPLTDDSEHIYFYDECGRYYINPDTRERVYKASAKASEYVMDPSGVLMKIKEVRDGITYYYDENGRYYINQDGKHIYREPDAASEYENDGLGNLVRIRSAFDVMETCPEDVRVSDDFNYLKCVIGKPLRLCIADVILHQPSDPVKYLSHCLIKYRQNMEFTEKLRTEREELEIERENIRAEERAAAERAALEAALLAQGGSEASFDSNMVKYFSLNQDDPDTTEVNTPTTARSENN